MTCRVLIAGRCDVQQLIAHTSRVLNASTDSFQYIFCLSEIRSTIDEYKKVINEYRGDKIDVELCVFVSEGRIDKVKYSWLLQVYNKVTIMQASTLVSLGCGCQFGTCAAPPLAIGCIYPKPHCTEIVDNPHLVYERAKAPIDVLVSISPPKGVPWTQERGCVTQLESHLTPRLTIFHSDKNVYYNIARPTCPITPVLGIAPMGPSVEEPLFAVDMCPDRATYEIEMLKNRTETVDSCNAEYRRGERYNRVDHKNVIPAPVYRPDEMKHIGADDSGGVRHGMSEPFMGGPYVGVPPNNTGQYQGAGTNMAAPNTASPCPCSTLNMGGLPSRCVHNIGTDKTQCINVQEATANEVDRTISPQARHQGYDGWSVDRSHYCDDGRSNDRLQGNPKSDGERYKRVMETNGPCSKTKNARLDMPLDEPAPSSTVFIHNLPYGLEDNDIKGTFDMFGEISKISFGGLRHKRYRCTITYKNLDDAVRLIKRQPLELKNRTVHVKYGRPERVAGGDWSPSPPPWDLRPHAQCWFCLANPHCERSLVVWTDKAHYIALAKGGINDSHFLLTPIGHYPALAFCPKALTDNLYEGVEDIKQILFARGFEYIFLWERYFPMKISHAMHMQIQIVGLKRGYLDKFQQSVAKCEKVNGVMFEKLATPASIMNIRERIADMQDSYTYIEYLNKDEKLAYIYSLSKSSTTRMGINMAREVICDMYDWGDRVNWKMCLEDAAIAQETADSWREIFTRQGQKESNT